MGRKIFSLRAFLPVAIFDREHETCVVVHEKVYKTLIALLLPFLLKGCYGCGVDLLKVLDTAIFKKSSDSSTYFEGNQKTSTRYTTVTYAMTSERCIDTFDTALT